METVLRWHKNNPLNLVSIPAYNRCELGFNTFIPMSNMVFPTQLSWLSSDFGKKTMLTPEHSQWIYQPWTFLLWGVRVLAAWLQFCYIIYRAEIIRSLHENVVECSCVIACLHSKYGHTSLESSCAKGKLHWGYKIRIIMKIQTDEISLSAMETLELM